MSNPFDQEYDTFDTFEKKEVTNTNRRSSSTGGSTNPFDLDVSLQGGLRAATNLISRTTGGAVGGGGGMGMGGGGGMPSYGDSSGSSTPAPPPTTGTVSGMMGSTFRSFLGKTVASTPTPLSAAARAAAGAGGMMTPSTTKTNAPVIRDAYQTPTTMQSTPKLAISSSVPSSSKLANNVLLSSSSSTVAKNPAEKNNDNNKTAVPSSSSQQPVVKQQQQQPPQPPPQPQQYITVGNKRLTRWPYDDYHQVQQLYYQKAAQHPQNRREKSSTIHPNHNASTFIRPPKLPDIPSAVVNLPLTTFEHEAEKRAINIVSHWLMDAGLIDELMTNGTAATAAGENDNHNHNHNNNNSVNNMEHRNLQHSHQSFLHGTSGKMDDEIFKLRNSTRQELSSINACLNDGVAQSGHEVQELVNAVVATKTDLKRLQQLALIVIPEQKQNTNGDDAHNNQYFRLQQYPQLCHVVHAQRNLSKCFRELDFFSRMSSTCDRLRDELHAGEWTAHEFVSLRCVCREHVELEIFLVETEGMLKKRVIDLSSESGYRQSNNNAEVDRFLSEHVSNVWELGDEIQLRVMAGIGNAFDLAVNNPGGMVALVEAVEVYEMANQEYRKLHRLDAAGMLEAGNSQLRFTDMRAAALGELYKDMELRCLEYYNEITMQNDVSNDPEEEFNEKFSSVLAASNRLLKESFVVKQNMVPCFPPYWEVETLWTSVLGHTCSKQILEITGGPEGHNLPDLTVTQLLDLVAWVESFRDIIEQIFPDIGEFSSKKTYFDKPLNLFCDNNKTVNIVAAKDSLARMNNILWDVHDAAKDEFLLHTKEQCEEWLENVYKSDHTKNQTANGRLTTSLCEDVYSLAGVQLKTIRDRLTKKSEALIQAAGVLFKNLYEKQIHCRDSFLSEFETCCAAANDFMRMTEKCEEIMEDLKAECVLTPVLSLSIEEQAATLLNLYSNDAVYAGQKTHVFIFDPIEEAITKDLFGTEWLDDLTHNELALTLVRTLDDFMEDLERYLDELIFQKTVESLVTASVLFYIKTLLSKADMHKSNRDPYFKDGRKALIRMAGDMVTIKKYFRDLSESMPALKRIIEREFEILDTIHEMMAIAAGLSTSEARDFILVLQKRVRNIQLTKFVVGDLYHLMNPSEERNIYELMDSMEEELKVVAPTDREAVRMATDRLSVPGLRLDQVMAKHVDQCRRKRPLKAGALEQAEAMLHGWRTTFVA